MYKILLFTLLPCLLVGGCPTEPGDNTGVPGTGGTSPAAIAGTWTGELTCTRTESLGTVEGSPSTETVTVTITFSDTGIPTALTVLGFTGAPEQIAEVNAVGETADQSSSGDNGLVIDQQVRITSTSFTSTEAQIGLSIDYEATGGLLMQSGTGTQTITATVTGDTLTYTSQTDYDIQQTTGVINLDTGEVIACTGTLQKAP